MHPPLFFTFKLIKDVDNGQSAREISSMPAIKLTKSNVHTLTPTPIGSPVFNLLKIEIVIGKHHARGIIRIP